MKNLFGKVLFFSYFFSCFFTLFTMHAHAYIDPSAVTYIIQGVAGVLIALGAAFTIFRHKIFKFFKGKKKEETTEDEIDGIALAKNYLSEGMSASEAAKRAAKESGMKKGDIYKALMEE